MSPIPTKSQKRAAALAATRQEKRAKQEISCAECHRLKLKCDRRVPCFNCVRRECSSICPNGTNARRRADDATVTELRERLGVLEGLLVQAVQDGSVAPLAAANTTAQEQQHQVGCAMSPQRTTVSPQHLAQRRSASPPPRRRRRSPTPPPPPGPVVVNVSPDTASSLPAGGAPSTVHFNYDTPSAWDAHSHSAASPRHHPRTPQFQHHQHHQQQQHHEPDLDVHGTLVIGRSGRSKWLGPTAGTEWLKDQEESRDSHSPPPHRPVTHQPFTAAGAHSSRFPFPAASHATLADLTCRLPPGDEAGVLVDSYYRYFSWNHDVAPRRTVQPILDAVYASLFSEHPTTTSPDSTTPSNALPSPQSLALIYALLAIGVQHNPDLPAHDSSGDEYVSLAESALVAGDFLEQPDLQGVQTLVLMGHYHADSRARDRAWPLWGMAMRAGVAMGLHRDGARWGLEAGMCEERRQVFWESITIETFQSNCFSRPCSLLPWQIDTRFPSQSYLDGPTGVKSFKILKYELGQLSSDVLSHAMDLRPKSYDTVLSLYARVCAFERAVPFELRCRAAMLALPSVYADAEGALADTPAVNRRNMHRTLQQFTLALNISETVLFLQRPYFVRALRDPTLDPTRTPYATSFLATVERCNVIINVAAGIHELYPSLTGRHWFYWHHMFTAAVTLGSFVLTAPRSVLAPGAVGMLDVAVGAFASAMREGRAGAGGEMGAIAENHAWLVRLRRRVAGKMARAGATLTGTGTVGGDGQCHNDAADDDEEDPEDNADDLIGWRTRLIERSATGVLQRTSVGGGSVAATEASSTGRDAGGVVEQQQIEFDPSTDFLLQQFWDPHMLLADGDALVDAGGAGVQAGGTSGGASTAPGAATSDWWNWDLDFDVAGATS